MTHTDSLHAAPDAAAPSPDDAEPSSRETAKPAPAAKPAPSAPPMPKEIGGPAGPEPTRYGDWERNGRCSDF